MVLPAIVDLVSEATACHACFVYLLERDRLVRWGHPEAYAPPNTGTPWLVWAGGSLAAGALAILLAVVIRALGGA